MPPVLFICATSYCKSELLGRRRCILVDLLCMAPLARALEVQPVKPKVEISALYSIKAKAKQATILTIMPVSTEKSSSKTTLPEPLTISLVTAPGKVYL